MTMTDPIHPVPECAQMTGRQQCPRDMSTEDTALETVTAGSLAGALVRLVAGWDPGRRTFSRTSRSFQIFKGLELSWMHAAGSNAAEILWRIATMLPTVAASAWGQDEALKMQNRNYVDGIIAQFKGQTAMLPQYDWLSAGWAWASARGDVQQLIVNWYFGDIVKKAMDWMMANGLTQARTLAAGTRARNTSGTQLQKLKDAVASQGEEAGVQSFLQGYKGGKYIPDIDAEPAFSGEIAKWPSPADVAWPGGESIVAPFGQMAGYEQLRARIPWRTIGYVGVGIAAAGLIGLVLLRRS